VPLVNIGSWVGYILFFIGLVMNASGLTWLGILLFSGGLVFALLTLPVERDASRRAVQMLQDNNLVAPEEMKGVRAVLSAASLTYVAAVVQIFSQLLYFVVLAMGGSRRRRF
jgi:Zn-dependent membrane protease YugP